MTGVTKKIADQQRAEALQLQKALDDMAVNISRISQAFATLGKTRVSRKLITLMVKDMTGVSYVDINKVLDALPALEKQYLK